MNIKFRYASNKQRTHEIIIIIILYIIAFFYAQSLYANLYNHSSFVRDYYKLTIIRFSIWVMPILIYLMISGKNPFNYLKLQGNILKGFCWGVIIGSIIIFYNIVVVYILKGHVYFNFSINKESWFRDLISIVKSSFGLYNVLLIISEEIVFRGFLLQKLRVITKFWIANIINAVLFVLIHIQGYIILNKFSISIMINAICGIFVFSIIQGLVLKKTNSLWACVLIHFFNDFISSAIIM